MYQKVLHIILYYYADLNTQVQALSTANSWYLQIIPGITVWLGTTAVKLGILIATTLRVVSISLKWLWYHGWQLGTSVTIAASYTLRIRQTARLDPICWTTSTGCVWCMSILSGNTFHVTGFLIKTDPQLKHTSCMDWGSEWPTGNHNIISYPIHLGRQQAIFPLIVVFQQFFNPGNHIQWWSILQLQLFLTINMIMHQI